MTAPGILDGDTDADGDTLTVASVNITGLQGTLNPQANGGFIFTPTAGFTGTTSFTYSVSDGFGSFDTGLVTINVEPDNRAPVIVAVADQTVSELGVLTIDVDATDPDGDTVTFELVSGPEGAFIDVATGQIVWSAPVLTPGVPLDFLVRATDGTTFADEAFTVTVLPDYLRVTSFASSANGFHVGFNRVFDVTTLNLYEGASAPRPLPPADVLLTTLGGTNQAGSIVLDEDQKGFTFIRTGAALAAGSYRATLTSSALGIHDLYGRALDGDADGNAGGNAVRTFTVAAPQAVLSIGDVARGPGQTLSVPANGTGLPIRLTGAGIAGATAVTFELAYDASLLDVRNVAAPPGSANRVTWLTLPDGRLQVSVTFATPMSAAGAEVARLIANVRPNAPYRATEILDISNVQVQVRTRTFAGQDNDGLHLVAYVGDATGDGRYTNQDIQQILQLGGSAQSGFAAFPLVDPVVVADASGDGRANVVDATLLLLEAIGLNRPEIPPIVVPAANLTFDVLATVGEAPAPLPFTALFGAQVSGAAGTAQATTKASAQTATPVINWQPPTNPTQPGTLYGARPEWLKSFVTGKGTSGTTAFSIKL